MMETITLRPAIEEWRKDLDLSMSPLGIYRMDHYKRNLLKELTKLEALLNEYQDVRAIVSYADSGQAPYWFRLIVRVSSSWEPFKAHVCYEVNEEKKLIAKIHCTLRASTEEFPLEGGVEWKTIILTESEITDPAYVAAYVKNQFICFESFNQIGRDILYAVLEE
jgi:hypothetical protein